MKCCVFTVWSHETKNAKRSNDQALLLQKSPVIDTVTVFTREMNKCSDDRSQPLPGFDISRAKRVYPTMWERVGKRKK